MIDSLVWLPAIAALFLSFVLALVVSSQNRRIVALQGSLAALRKKLEDVETPALPAPDLPSPLEGLRIALSIEQDHSRPTFAGLLRDRLIGEDADVDTEPAPVGEWPEEAGPDIVISGKLTCNGYAEVFYEVDLKCLTRHGLIAAVVESPTQGGRQVDLAGIVVNRLKQGLQQAVSRAERRRALREIRED